MTSQCRVDAPVDWVRRFLLIGTHEDDVSFDGDTLVIRQRDRLIDLVVRNTLTADGDGTMLDVDAELRLLGLGRVVGTLFSGRVRRTLVRSLDRLPTAIEQALEHEEVMRREGDDAALSDDEADGTPAA